MTLEKSLTGRSWAVLAIACLLLILQFTVLISTRWVEDESWLSSEAWMLSKEGTARMAIFPADPRSVVSGSLPVYIHSLAASFSTFGIGVVQARLVSLVAGIG